MRLLWLLGMLALGCRGQFSVPEVDAPELAKLGTFPVGVRTVQLVSHERPDVLKAGAPASDRVLPVEIWYPADAASGAKQTAVYQDALTLAPGSGNEGTSGASSFSIPGIAHRDAVPRSGERFPLVVVSHGYPGSRFFLSYLTENLASKGYVVAAIDHTDSVTGAVRDFKSTLFNRAADQLFVIDELRRLDDVDAARVAIVGYSMGAYGAMLAGGAGLSSASPLVKAVPGGLMSRWQADDKDFQAIDRSAIKAIVAIAPWGNQPPYMGWDAAGATSFKEPLLMIAGDHDDVAEYGSGIRPLFDKLSQSERYLLIYKDARHNTGGNPAPHDVAMSLPQLEHFAEPVWRKERICEINQHFITAFLDLYVKGDEGKRRFLGPPPHAPSKDEEPWPGFAPRWWLGLEFVAAGAKPESRFVK